jgi:hypothetical protein
MKFVIAALIFSTAACAGTAEVTYRAPLPSSTSMVQIDSGVYAVADQDDPVFYADNFYWRYDSGVWYRSRYHTGGWAIARPPAAVARIDRPRSYVHYRPANWVAHRPPPPARGPAPGYARTGYAPPAARPATGFAPPHAAPPARGFQPAAVQARPGPRPMATPARGFAPRPRDHRDFHR